MWLQTQREIANMFICQAENMSHKHPCVLDLILEMMPDSEQAKKMAKRCE
jgi:hypothetical protein